jgi:hypothetical protein
MTLADPLALRMGAESPSVSSCTRVRLSLTIPRPEPRPTDSLPPAGLTPTQFECWGLSLRWSSDATTFTRRRNSARISPLGLIGHDQALAIRSGW